MLTDLFGVLRATLARDVFPDTSAIQIISLARELAASGEDDIAPEILALREGHSDTPTFLSDGKIQLELTSFAPERGNPGPPGDRGRLAAVA